MASVRLSEFALIARITAGLPASPAVEFGVGDDAAVLKWEADLRLVVTCDAQVEGVHFLRAQATPEQIGRRALAINVSDIAAMGGVPHFAVVSLCIPPDVDATWIERLYAGLRTEAEHYQVSIVGGNVSAIEHSLVIDVTLLGSVRPGHAILRSGARSGDRICVTGDLGKAAAGLLTLLEPRKHLSAKLKAAFAEAQSAEVTPQARVKESAALADTGHVTAMLDISDGLAADLWHMCESSHVGATLAVEALPIHPATQAVAHAYGRSARELALYGGEDYELLFTVPPSAEQSVLQAVSAAGGTATAIGWITQSEDGLRLLLEDNTSVPLVPRGWDHLVSRYTSRPPGSVSDGGYTS